MSEAISEETRLTSQVMESLEAALDQARQTLRQAMKKLNRAFRSSKSNHMTYVFVFALAIFFAVYWWNKVFKFLRWLF